jgi:hypothetical protein
MSNGCRPCACRVPRLFPSIISDNMDALLHPATGVTTDSKAAFRRMTRERGYEEIGNEVDAHVAGAQPRTQAITDADIAQAYEMVEQGYVPPPNDVADADIRIL